MNRMYRKVADSKRGEYKFKTANLIFLGVKKNTKGNPVFMFKYPDGNQFSIFAQNDYNYTHGNADKFIQGEVGEYEHFANLDEMEQFFVNFIKKHGSKSQIDKLEVEESMPSRFSDSRRIKDEFEDKEGALKMEFYFDDYLFQENLAEDTNFDGRWQDFEVDWDLVNDVCIDVEEELRKTLASYFNTQHCSFTHGGRISGDSTYYSIWVKQSVLMDKMANELPIEDISEESDNSYDILLRNNNSELSSLWSDSIINALIGTYSSDEEKRILYDVVEVYLMGADMWLIKPAQDFKDFIESLR